MIRVEFTIRQRSLKPDRSLLRRVVRSVLHGEAVAHAAIHLAFVDDSEIARVHARFLGDPSPTDIISFPLSAPGQSPLEAELVISVETAVRVAKESGHSVQSELSLYVVHGLLHLCGYDDHRVTDRRRMRKRETDHLERLGIELNARPD